MEDTVLTLKTRPLSNAVGTEILDFDMTAPVSDEIVHPEGNVLHPALEPTGQSGVRKQSAVQV